jgi:predicted Zn-dependent protease
MEDTVTVAEFKQAVKHLREGYPEDALDYFRHAVEREKGNPYYLSFLGVCIARAQRKWDEALELCEAALRSKRNEPQFYLNLAEVYACAGRRGDAIEILDGGLTYCGTDDRIRRARNRFGKRGSAVLPFLERHHFLNKNLGKLRHGFSEMIARIQRGSPVPSRLSKMGSLPR